MASLENMRKDLERGLSVRLKRVNHSTEKGGPTGSAVELESAEKDVHRATARLERARIAHQVTTAEVQQYADALTNLGGTPVLPEGFSVYTAPTASTPVQDGEITDTAPGNADIVPTDIDGVDAAGDFTDPDRNGSANLDETDGEPEDKRPRVGGRFARRGTQV